MKEQLKMNEYVKINFDKIPKFERDRLYQIVIEGTRHLLAEQKNVKELQVNITEKNQW